MDHGVKNEHNAATTLLVKILSTYYPKMVFQEVGSYVMKRAGEVFVVTSPDGEGYVNGKLIMTFEFKCPTIARPFLNPVHYTIPIR